MATEKRLIYLEDAIEKIVDTPSSVAQKAFDGEYGFIQNPGAILVDRQFEIINLIEKVSAKDAVEVVRCKDCRYCETKRGSRYKQLLRFCVWGDGWERVQSDGKFFCAHGKRREYATD